MLTKKGVDLKAERSGGVYLVSLYDPHIWMLGEKAHTHSFGYYLPSVISGGRLCFLIVDMAAISWIWKKQKKDRGF